MRFSSQAKSFPLGDSITLNCRVRRSCAKSDDAVYDDSMDMVCSLLQQSPSSSSSMPMSMPVPMPPQSYQFPSTDSLSMSLSSSIMAGTASPSSPTTTSISTATMTPTTTTTNNSLCGPPISLADAGAYSASASASASVDRGIDINIDIDELSSNSSTGSNVDSSSNKHQQHQQQQQTPSQSPPYPDSGPALFFQPIPKPPSRTPIPPPRTRLPSTSSLSSSTSRQRYTDPHSLLVASRTQLDKNKRRRKRRIEKRKSLASAAAACFATTPRDAGTLTDDDFDFESSDENYYHHSHHDATSSDYEFDSRSVDSNSISNSINNNKRYPPFFLRMEDVTRVEWSSLKSTQPAATTNRRKSKITSAASSSSSSMSKVRHPQMLIVTISTSTHHTELNFYNQQNKALLVAFLRSTLPKKVFRVKSIVGSSMPVVVQREEGETEEEEEENERQKPQNLFQEQALRPGSSNRSMLNLIGTDSGSYVDMENFEGKALRERFQNESFFDKMKRRCARLAIRAQEACFCYDLDCVREDLAKELDHASTVNTSVMTEMELDIFDEYNETMMEGGGVGTGGAGGREATSNESHESVLLQLVGGLDEIGSGNNYQRNRHLELEKVLSSLSNGKQGKDNKESDLEDVFLDDDEHGGIGQMLELTFSDEEANLFGNNTNCCMETSTMDIQKSFLMQ